MYFVEIALFVVSLVLLVIGYRKNHRNLLLSGAIVLFLSSALGPMATAFWNGYTEARATR